MRTIRSISVNVGEDNSVIARRDDGARSDAGRIRLDGIDADLVRFFQRWIVERSAGWRLVDVRAFGAVMHRALFESHVWDWIEGTLADLDEGERLRLQLAFPYSGPRHLAAIPWEYLYAPDSAGSEGYFLATDERLVLSRYVPAQGKLPPPESQIRLLLVVAQPSDEERVVAETVVETVREVARKLPAALTELGVAKGDGATPDALAAALARSRPHLVHFVGHGDYDEREATGRVALVDIDGRAKWVTPEALGGLFKKAKASPRVIVLHSCEGGAVDSQISFAGTAPQLVRDGVPCVVAMQYKVTPTSATAFAQAFYDGLEHGLAVDEAAQQARQDIAGAQSFEQDPRLLGIPVVYVRSRGGVLLAAR